MTTYTQAGVEVVDEATADPNIRRARVPHGTPMPEWVTSRSVEFPSADFDTWYYPTQAAYLLANIDAAFTTIQDLPAHAADTFNNLSDMGKWVVGGLGLLVILEILKRK